VSLGRDVRAEPRLELVRERDAVPAWLLEEGTVLSSHPHVVDPEERAMGDTGGPRIVRPSGGQVLRGEPLGLHRFAR
jgi:hypothetical protein